MNGRELIQEWVRRLRSGDYRQGGGALHNAEDDTFCCLGVLCEIAVEEKVIPPPTLDRDRYVYAGSPSILPTEVSEWFYDLTWIRVGSIGKLDRGEYLTVLNDNKESFKSIAHVVEEQYLNQMREELQPTDQMEETV
jgi:hypothetical protein